MKILSIPQGRVVWVADLTRVNPQGRSLLDVIQAVGERYRFAKSPQHLLDVNSDKALEFNSGTFLKDGLDLRVGLTIYNNAVIADAISSTDTAESLLEDLSAWLASEHDLRVKPEVTKRGYLSKLEVQAKGALPLWDPRLAFVRQELESGATTMDGEKRRFEVNGIILSPNDAGQTSAPAQFQIDRKWGTEADKHIYYSQCTMKTTDHLALLDKIESALLGATRQ